MKFKRNGGFTLAEMLVAAAVGAVVSLGLVSFSWVSARLSARNLAFNHGTAALTGTANRLTKDLQGSGSIFTLVDFNGTGYTDSTVSMSSDVDPLSGQYLSTRSNAVRFWKTASDPVKLNVSTTPTTIDLSFNFGPLVGGQLPYTPAVNDKLWFPLLDQEFQIISVVTAPTTSSTTGVVRIHNSAGVGYTLSTTSPNVTTAIFFHQVAYSVYNNTLRYHPNFSNSPASCNVACNNITSPKPFAVLYATSSASASPRTDLRISFEAYDLDYSSFKFPNGAATLQSTISVRDQPPFVSALQTPL
jgi:prepilin-type N-terminal cleavage/methylation domain-containing protein